jgi:hypothetical protein
MAGQSLAYWLLESISIYIERGGEGDSGGLRF